MKLTLTVHAYPHVIVLEDETGDRTEIETPSAEQFDQFAEGEYNLAQWLAERARAQSAR